MEESKLGFTNCVASPIHLHGDTLFTSQVEEVLRTRKDLFKRKVQGVRPGDPLANPDPDPDP